MHNGVAGTEEASPCQSHGWVTGRPENAWGIRHVAVDRPAGSGSSSRAGLGVDRRIEFGAARDRLGMWGLRNRAAWSLLAVLGMAAGTGLLVWGIVSAAMHEPMPIGSPPAIIGVGAGCLAGAVALLVISFVGRRDSKS